MSHSLAINRRFCVAPMMRYTDCHFRYLLRLISRHSMLYTEMITDKAIIYGKHKSLLKFDKSEHPLAVQLGGNKPASMAEAAIIAEACGYDEININAGCPSPKVKCGGFGASLMLNPLQVADCVNAMRKKTTIPITVKCRIGVDNHDSYSDLHSFIEHIANSGCKTFIIHARKALLNGISPKQNRQVPTLRYDYVYQIKQDFPELEIILNGGITILEEGLCHLNSLDGVMLGRSVRDNPMSLTQVDQLYYSDTRPIPTRTQILIKYLFYMKAQSAQSVPLTAMTKHIFNIYRYHHGAKEWRRLLSEKLKQTQYPLQELENQIMNKDCLPQ